MKPITINNKIYGRFKITEPILIELIKSKALSRLKMVGNKGATDLHCSSVGYLSRYQHSVGVMLLLRKFNAGLKEQVAGLLHDVSHTAFSHVSDFVFGTPTTHDYQNSKMAKAFEIQGINKILKKHKFGPDEILDEKNFPLLEQDLPNLCADRIDYALQDPNYRLTTNIKPQRIIKNLTVNSNQFVFKNKTWAKKFGIIFLKLDQKTWCNPLELALYQILADAIKIALKKNIIDKKDLFTTDKFLINKLRKANNLEINDLLDKLTNLKIKLTNNKEADFYIKSKPRTVDPYFLKNNRLIKLSTVDSDFKHKIDSWNKKARQGFLVKIIN